MKNELIKIIKEKSFKHTDEPTFKLASGQLSRFYVNCKPTILSPRGMFLVGNLVLDAVIDSDIVAVGGLTFGADPISIATSFASEIRKTPLKAFSIRKEQKDHGIIKWVEGDLQKGDRVAIMEDVITTGGSTIKAIERARSEGLEVVKVITLIDRMEGGVENVKKHIPDVEAIITREELMRL